MSIYYKVFKPDGSPSNCILKLYMNDESSGLERKPTYSLTKEGDCADVPTLRINKLKNGCGVKGPSGGCLTDKTTKVNYFSSGFNVYFEGQAVAEASSAAALNVTSAAEPTDGSLTAASPAALSAAAMPLGGAMATIIVAIAMLVM
jgi:hypothetical protein